MRRSPRRPEKPANRPKYLTPDELRRFFAVISSPRDRALFAVIYQYGLRADEATRLTLEDVDLKHQRIEIRRLQHSLGGARPLARHTTKVLKSYLQERNTLSRSLFTGRKGPLKKRQIQNLFTHYANAAGLRGRSVHALRHSVAVHLLEAGHGIGYVAHYLGHKNIQNTRMYIDSSPQVRDQTFREFEQHPKTVTIP